MDILNILLWIAVIVFVFLVAWSVLGSSPTLDQVMFAFTILFLIFNIKSEKDARFVKSKVSKLDRLDDIYNILKDKGSK